MSAIPQAAVLHSDSLAIGKKHSVATLARNHLSIAYTDLNQNLTHGQRYWVKAIPANIQSDIRFIYAYHWHILAIVCRVHTRDIAGTCIWLHPTNG